MFKVRRAEDRGRSNHGWLDSYHTFSFSGYHDQENMGFGALRVINDDRVEPGEGFGMHPHQDMEIISYVLSGTLAHEDSLGNGSEVQPGEVQRMSAGTGVRHSEFNPSAVEPVHFLQIWLYPSQTGLTPEYEQKLFNREAKKGRWCLVVSPDGVDGSMRINQDARLYATVLEAGMSLPMPISRDRRAWLQVAQGEVGLNDLKLNAGDGVAISDEDRVGLVGIDEAEVLLFDLK